MKRRIGDRKDGYKLRKANPFFRLIPHIMPERNDAQIFFEERVYLDKPNEVIRQLRREGHRVGFLHIVLASMVRVISQKPKVNRFVVGKRTYARNEISISLAVKKEMKEEAEETTIKVKFQPTDTIYDVIERVNDAIENNKGESEDNNTDKFAKFFHVLPQFIVTFAVWFIKWMDRHNMLPKFILELSPFHSSLFVTDLGSLGIKPVYHHIYNFGTNTIFIAFGVRSKEQIIDDDLSVSQRKAMDLKVVADERVVDGYYFASAIKLAMRIMSNPEVLLTPPEAVFEDDEI
ncbi:2-oxoglutarate dehydrogenase [Candidatus Xianfuyuplasma coldseepsis]|uniref:2-oxoglutarate dehydrogenase n=1 Tax=Candidatus Xianfuyuplasma coldseepsis TaxID=2782163 RepID=A0A7L7KT21_9MOLU|nr:2-oxoglutarate dehydrogenase [Xianfuyuplasma coldseepsis]QMS85961.1 2-oxoglutarate dehydrogenase [Xianfuyuplasma coldseepsis]